MFRLSNTSGVKLHHLPIVPDLITNLDDLHDNFKLYTDANITILNQRLLDDPTKPDRRYQKEELIALGIENPRYGVVKSNGCLYAIYNGCMKDESAVAFGSFAKIKAQQDLKSGVFSILKIVRAFTLEEWKVKFRELIPRWQEAQLSEDDINLFLIDIYAETVINEQASLKQAISEADILNHRKRRLFFFNHAGKRRPGTAGKRAAKLLGMLYEEGTELYKQEQEVRQSQWQLSPLQHLKIMIGIIKACWSCYQDGVIHRDIKAENFISGLMHHISLIDYGLSIKMAQIVGLLHDNRLVGTSAYIAPEIIRLHALNRSSQAQIPYGVASEIYAMGLVMAEHYCLAVDTNKFFGFERRQINPDLTDELLRANPSLPSKKERREVIVNTLNRTMNDDPNSRPVYEVVYDIFNNLYKDCCKEEKITVCLVPASEILATANIYEFVATLKAAGVNAVALIDDIERHDKQYSKAVRQLKKGGVQSIALEVFVGSKISKIEKAVSDYYQKEFQTKPIICQYEEKNAVFAEKIPRHKCGLFNAFSRQNQRGQSSSPALIALP